MLSRYVFGSYDMTSLYSSTPHHAQGSVPSFPGDPKVKWGHYSLHYYCDKLPDRSSLRKESLFWLTDPEDTAHSGRGYGGRNVRRLLK